MLYMHINMHINLYVIQLLQLDLSSAFDSISHDIFINRLTQIGITRDSLQILIQLIKDRTYSVNIHESICIYESFIVLF